MPILEERPTAVASQDEILHPAILALRKFPERGFFLTRPYDPPALLATPEVQDPQVSQRCVMAFLTGTREKSAFTIRSEKAVVQPMNTETIVDDEDDDDAFRSRRGDAASVFDAPQEHPARTVLVYGLGEHQEARRANAFGALHERARLG